jgi:hypothetical protein
MVFVDEWACICCRNCSVPSWDTSILPVTVADPIAGKTMGKQSVPAEFSSITKEESLKLAKKT